MRNDVGALLALVFLAATPLGAQEEIPLDDRFTCVGEATALPAQAFAFRPTEKAREVLDEVLAYIGLSGKSMELMASHVPGVVATIHPVSQKRLILYDEEFIRDLEEVTQSVWTRRAVLAHELAHHLDSHLQSGDPERRRVEELAADRFAGHVLFKFDADLETVTAVFEGLKSGGAYPPTEARVAAATNGWWTASEQSNYDRPTGGEVVAGPNDVPLARDVTPDFSAGDSIPNPIAGGALLATHQPFVPHVGGLSGGPGLSFQMNGTVHVPRSGQLSVAVFFRFPNGAPLYAHPQERNYRGMGNVLATGRMETVAVPQGEFELSQVLIDPIPHYALNLVPSGFNTTYWIEADAFLYLDGEVLLRLPPTTISVVW